MNWNRHLAALAALAPLPLLGVATPAGADASARVVFSAHAEAHPAIAGLSGSGVRTITGLPVATVDGGGDPATAARRIARLPGVEWAEVAPTYSTSVPRSGATARATATDPRRKSQWALSMIHVESGWNLAGINGLSSPTGVPIGIVDTGVDPGHSDLQGRIRACAASFAGRVREGACDDRDGHGTHVSGIAAARAWNGIGIAGVAAASPLVVCRALGSPGQGSGADVAGCVGWVLRHGARIISMSLGGPDSRTLRTAVEAASAAGALIVAAAGNEGDGSLSYPAGYRSVVSVAAVGPDGRRARYSNSNVDVEISAPGSAILSLAPRNRYVELSGTSMAVPHVSGAAALLWQSLPMPTAAAVRSALSRATRDVGTRGRDRDYGYGILDLALARI